MLTAAASTWLRLTGCSYRPAKRTESKPAASDTGRWGKGQFSHHRFKDHGGHFCWLELPGIDLY